MDPVWLWNLWLLWAWYMCGWLVFLIIGIWKAEELKDALKYEFWAVGSALQA